MATPVPNPPSEMHKLQIDILFKEYDTLRQEILDRMNNRFKLVGFGTGLAVFIADDAATILDGALIMAWLAGLLMLWLRTDSLILRCSARIADIENHINAVAGGADLLAWERRYTGHLSKNGRTGDSNRVKQL